jgi:hypothetical protein
MFNSFFQKIAPHVPVVGSAFGFVKTCIKVSRATSPAGAVVKGCKCIILDCTPPVIKYPALCAAALGCTVAGCLTGDANFIVGALECSKAILDS